MSTNINKKKYIRNTSYIVLALLTLSFFSFIIPPFHYDDSNAITGTPIASDTTLSISVDNDVLSLDLTPLSTNGTFATTTTPATIYVTTNNITGYTLGIRTTTSTDTAIKLINNIDECIDTPTSTKCSLSTIDTAVSEQDYEATTSTDLNNTWGYLPSKYNSLDNTDYLPAPSTGELDILDVTDAPNAVNTNNTNNNNNTTTDNTLEELTPTEYTINLGSRIDYTPYAGQYSGTLIVTAVGNLVPYSVSYNANKPTPAPVEATVSNVPGAQINEVGGGSEVAVVLRKNVPTLLDTATGANAGYVFAGWCTEPTTEDPTTGYQSCPGAIFQPGDYYGIDQTSDNLQTLYAIWGAPATVTFDGNNGLVFNGVATDTTNTMGYIPTYAGNVITGDKTNTVYNGTYLEPAPLDPSTNYIFKGWSMDAAATEPTYVTEQDIINNLNLNANDNITLYAVWAYTTIITFDGNGADGGKAMNSITVEAGQKVSLPANTYTYTDHTFMGWNNEPDGSGTKTYTNEASFTAGNTSESITLYAQWQLPTTLTFTAGDNIDTLIVADSNFNLKPFYVTSDAVDRSLVLPLTPNTKYLVTIVPKPGYVISSDSSNSSWTSMFNSGTLSSNTLLTTTYTAGSDGDVLTVSAAEAGSDSAHLAYTQMKDLTAAQCPAYNSTAKGINVTDTRDHKSYTVAKFGNYCYMLSNIRLDGGTELVATNGLSHVTIDYTLPEDTGESGWVSDACKPYMATAGGEYYYNWPAATARINSTVGASGCNNDTTNSAGDICPANWSLPTYQDITPLNIWNNKANPGMLATSGYFSSGSQNNVGSDGRWWSSSRYNDAYAYYLYIDGTSAYRNYYYYYGKGYGYSVRCMRSS